MSRAEVSRHHSTSTAEAQFSQCSEFKGNQKPLPSLYELQDRIAQVNNRDIITHSQDRRYAKQFEEVKKLQEIEDMKHSLLEEYKTQYMAPPVPLPSNWDPSKPINTKITSLYNIKITPHYYPVSFYKGLQYGMSGNQPVLKTKIEDTTRYPNFLVSNEYNKKMTIVKRTVPGRMTIADIMGVYRHSIPTTFNRPFYKVLAVYIHAASTPLQITDGETTINLPEKRSIELQIFDLKDIDDTEKLNDIKISPSEEIGIFAVEFIFQDDIPNPFLNRNFLIIESDMKISDQIIRRRGSFIRKPLTEQEIKNRIRVIDGEYAIDDNRKHHLVSIVILDYNGAVLMHTLVKPRSHIKDIVTDCHGIKDVDVRGQMDEYWALAEIHRHLQGNILLGHDVQLEIKACAIPLQSLMGIRDTSAGKIFFDKYGLDPTKPFISLKALAAKVLGITVQKGYHSAKKDAGTVLDIYRTVENEWIDTISIQESQQLLGKSKKQKTPAIINQDKPESINYPPSVTTDAWIMDKKDTGTRILNVPYQSTTKKTQQWIQNLQDPVPCKSLRRSIEHKSIIDLTDDDDIELRAPSDFEFSPINVDLDASPRSELEVCLAEKGQRRNKKSFSLWKVPRNSEQRSETIYQKDYQRFKQNQRQDGSRASNRIPNQREFQKRH